MHELKNFCGLRLSYFSSRKTTPSHFTNTQKHIFDFVLRMKMPEDKFTLKTIIFLRRSKPFFSIALYFSTYYFNARISMEKLYKIENFPSNTVYNPCFLSSFLCAKQFLSCTTFHYFNQGVHLLGFLLLITD